METGGLSDANRLAAVRASGLMDTGPDDDFDRLVRLAVHLLGAPAAFVTVLDDERQYIKSAAGTLGDSPVPPGGTSTTLDRSYCRHTIALGRPLLIEDARAHELVCNNPAVEDGAIAYAGVPLAGEGGEAIGALCVVSSEPRRWSGEDVENLLVLSRSAASLLESRRRDVSDAPDDTLLDGAVAHLSAVNAYNRLLAADQDEFDIGREAVARRELTSSQEHLERVFERTSPAEEALHPELVQAVRQYLDASRRREEFAMTFRRGSGTLEQLEGAIALHLETADALRVLLLDHRVDM